MIASLDVIEHSPGKDSNDSPNSFAKCPAAHYFENRKASTPARIRFWLTELRTPELLIEVARNARAVARRLTSSRPLLAHAISGNTKALLRDLGAEESAEARATWGAGVYTQAQVAMFVA